MRIVRRFWVCSACLLLLSIYNVQAAYRDETQICYQYGGFATQPALWYIRLADGSRIPVEMPSEQHRPPFDVSASGRYTYQLMAQPASPQALFSLSLTDTLTGETRLIAEDIKSRVGRATSSDRFAYMQSIDDVDEDEFVKHYRLNIQDPISQKSISTVLTYESHAPWLTQIELAWSPNDTVLAVVVSTEYQSTTVTLIETGKTSSSSVKPTEIVSFEVDASQHAAYWSPHQQKLALIDMTGDNGVALYDLHAKTVTNLPLTAQTYRRISWSPDETYLVDYGTWNDFEANLNVATTTGELIIKDLHIISVDDAGTPVYGWLDNHTLITLIDLEVEGISEVAQIDLITGDIAALEGAELEVIPCTSDVQVD